jgi:uncharacterized coiled-coil DUF342 family protein
MSVVELVGEIFSMGRFIADKIKDAKERKEFKAKLVRLSKAFAESQSNLNAVVEEANGFKVEIEDLKEQIFNLLSDKANNYRREG